MTVIKLEFHDDKFHAFLNASFFDDVIGLQLDTGADCTALTLHPLLNIREKGVIQRIAEFLQREMLDKKYYLEFRAANRTPIQGIRCVLHNISISGMKIKKFYFFLSLDYAYSLTLLGKEFFICCSFFRNYDADLIVRSFHSERYLANCRKYLHTDSLDEYTIDFLSVVEMVQAYCRSLTDQKEIPAIHWNTVSHPTDSMLS